METQRLNTHNNNAEGELMSTMKLEVHEGVHVLTLTNNEGENKFNLDVMHEYMAALDEVDAYKGNTALLIRCEHEKTFSTGIDLEWMLPLSEEDRGAFVLELERVLYRIALLRAPTIACLNGNTYAGGAILVSAFDFRFMRADKGRFCFPEVNIKIPFSPLMIDIVNTLPDSHARKVLTLTGKPLTGVECEASKIVDAVYSAEELQAQAFGFAKMMSEKDRTTYATIRNSQRENVSRHASKLGF